MIGRRRVRRLEDTDDAPEYWIAYSDLMVSLLMVFALLLFLALARMQRVVEDAEVIVEGLSEAIKEASAGLRGSTGSIHFDPHTGALLLDAEVLFGYGSSNLRPEARRAVEDVALRYMPVVLKNPAVDTMLQEIVVEGHTDTIGSYMSNLQLSQARAYSVMKAMVESTYGTPHAPRLRELVVASGKSEIRPVRINGRIDQRRSRRIEIHFRTRNDVLLQRIFKSAGAKGVVDMVQ